MTGTGTEKKTVHFNVEGSKGKGKGKAVPLQTWTGPEGSRKLRLVDFVTVALDGGKVVSLTHRPPLPPGYTTGRAETECDGTRKRTGGEVKGKKANGGGSQQSCTIGHGLSSITTADAHTSAASSRLN